MELNQPNGDATSSKKMKNLFSLIFLVAVILLAVYFLLPDQYKVFRQAETDPAYFDFTVARTDLTDEQVESYRQRFEASKASLEEDEGQLEGWLVLGSVMKTIGNFKGAEAAWLKANEVRPLNSISFGNLADLYASFIQDYDKAILMYEKAIANSRGEAKNVSFYRNLYYLYYYNLKDYQKAESTLLAAMADNPESSDSLTLLASFYEETGNKEKAIEYYRKVLDLGSENKDAIRQAIENLSQ